MIRTSRFGRSTTLNAATGRRYIRRSLVAARALAAGWLLAASALHAQGLAPSGWFAQFGSGAQTRSLLVGATWDWDRHWRLGPGEVGGYWEASLGRWSTTGLSGGATAWVTQLGVTPVFRFRPDAGTSRWFLEGAIGLNLLMPIYHSNDKRFSTSANFGDHLGVGLNFGPNARHEVVLRIEHFSNGGIRHPNPGKNFLQLRYASRF